MLPLNQLETWLADIGARETYNDVIDDILLGTENNVHLSKPISTITLEMKKRKMPK